MRQVSLEEIAQMTLDSANRLWELSIEYGREPHIYLHWSACRYDTCFDDYHINITGDGKIYVSVDDFSEILPHTYCRNTGSIGISLCCAYNATTNNLGDYPPTQIQIETMTQIINVVARNLSIPIDKYHVLTHGEAADNIDGIYASEAYGPVTTVERWDLQFLGTEESPYYTTDYDDEHTGGNVLRGKAIWYSQQEV